MSEVKTFRLLDLFCGAGGAAMGYHRAGFEVVGVDIKPQPHFPFEFHQADALTYPLEGFDVIHASPPCQRYSICTPDQYKGNHPDLIGPIRERLAGKRYVIENVPGARKKLRDPIRLCGSAFGLPIWRHRYFEINPMLAFLIPPCNHSNIPVLITGTTRRKGYPRVDPPIAVRRKAMDIPWMTISELDQAIPPAYCEFIGKQLLSCLRASERLPCDSLDEHKPDISSFPDRRKDFLQNKGVPLDNVSSGRFCQCASEESDGNFLLLDTHQDERDSRKDD